MDYLKIQTEAMKNYHKVNMNPMKNKMEYHHYQYKDQQGIGSPHHICFIPDMLIYLDLEKVFHNAFNVERIIDQCDFKQALMTDTMRSENGKTFVLFKVGDNDVWIDQKYLNYFDLKYSHFKGVDAIHPIQIYEGDSLVGIIQPVMMRCSK